MIIFWLLATLSFCDCVNVYSSFWAPLYDPRILNYRVDIKYDPKEGENARDDYQNKYGYRGEKLIADLGNGHGLKNQNDQAYGDVKFYYTYPKKNSQQ